MTKPIRILIYTRAFPPMVGGIETITMELARKLSLTSGSSSHQDLHVTVVTPNADAAPNEANLPFKIVRNPDVLRFVRLILQADIFHIAGADMLPLFLGWFLRKPVIVEHFTFQAVCPNGQMFYEPHQTFCSGHYMAGNHRQCLSCNRSATGALPGLKRWMLTFPRRWFCLQASANVVPTAWVATQLKLPRTTLIHLGLPAKTLLPSHYSAVPKIVHIGRLVSTKGTHVLVQAVDQLSDCDFELNVIGDGPERKHLQAQVRSLGLENRVHFHGYLPDTETDQILAQASAVVMPSLAGETFGLVALETMMRGKTVIASDLGALAEVVGDAGFTFSSGDPAALAACLRSVLQSNKTLHSTETRARARAQSVFSTQGMVKEHLVLYRQLLGASAGDEVTDEVACDSAGRPTQVSENVGAPAL